jgi:hypothetical protein
MNESKEGKRRGKKLVAACVSEELHEMGIRMVTDFFEMDGWDTYYIGANTPIESIGSAVRDQHADVVALSSTMSFHLPLLKKQIRIIRNTSDIANVLICEDYRVGVPAEQKNAIFLRKFYIHSGFRLYLSREILSITGITISKSGTEGTGTRLRYLFQKGTTGIYYKIT